MKLQKIEQIVGITAIAVLILCLVQAYLHHAVLPILWLRIYAAVGSSWAILYIWKIGQAYFSKKLFFTNTLKWSNIVLYLGIMFFLLYLNWQRNDGDYSNMRYAVALSFLLIGIANVKNYINFSDETQIELSYQSIIVHWDDILRFEKTPNGYGIITQNEGRYAILNEHLQNAQLTDFQLFFDDLIKNYDEYSSLNHFGNNDVNL